MKSRWLQAFACGLAAAAAAFALHAGGALDLFERQALDAQLRRRAGPAPQRSEAAVVVIDEHCIEYFRRPEVMGMGWPWRRETYRYLVDACAAAGARAVVFDILFLDPSSYGAEDDRAFAAALDAYGRGHLPVMLRDPDTSPIPAYAEALPLAPELAGAKAGRVHIRLPEDSDGVSRRYETSARHAGAEVPSVALAAARACGVEPPDAEPRLLTYRWKGQPFPVLDAAQLVNGEADVSLLKDRVVLVGVSAEAAYDLRNTPVRGQAPGVTIHAYALADLLDGRRLVPASGAAVAAALAALALAAAFLTRLGSAAFSVPIALLMMAAVPAATLGALAADVWLPAVAMEVAVLTAALLTAAVNYAAEGRRRRQVKRAFAHYVSAGVVEKLLRDPDAIALGGERKELTVMFLDFAGFTTLSEKLDPIDLVRHLNEYHGLAVAEILAEDGTWNKFIGDAVMAFWGEPVDQPDHAARACRAALAIQRRLTDLAARLSREGGVEMHARIGLHTGLVIVGNMGSTTYMDYTVIGDDVNLASRLEGVNKMFGTRVLVSEATLRAAGDGLAARALGSIQVKGKERAVPVYELLDAPRAPGEFERGLEAFRNRDWEGACAAFAAAGDGASKFYMDLCDRLRDDPPPEDWAGEIRLTEK